MNKLIKNVLDREKWVTKSWDKDLRKNYYIYLWLLVSLFLWCSLQLCAVCRLWTVEWRGPRGSYLFVQRNKTKRLGNGKLTKWLLCLDKWKGNVLVQRTLCLKKLMSSPATIASIYPPTLPKWLPGEGHPSMTPALQAQLPLFFFYSFIQFYFQLLLAKNVNWW